MPPAPPQSCDASHTWRRFRTTPGFCKTPFRRHCSMSVLGHNRTNITAEAMSALASKADIERPDWHVRFVPLADIMAISLDHLVGRAQAASAHQTALMTIRRHV